MVCADLIARPRPYGRLRLRTTDAPRSERRAGGAGKSPRPFGEPCRLPYDRDLEEDTAIKVSPFRSSKNDSTVLNI